MRPSFLVAGLAALALASTAAAQSQSDPDSRLRDQLRSTVQQLRDLQDSQATLQAQKIAAEQERDRLKAKVGSGSGAGSAAQARRDARVISGLRSDVDKAKADNAALQMQIQQLQADLARSQEQLAVATANGQALSGERDGLKTTLSQCVAKNLELIKLGGEILHAYEHVSFADVAARKEPFLGLKRVQLQNLAQDYRDKLDDGRFAPGQAPAPARSGG